MKPPLEHTLSLPQAPAIVNERHRRIMALLHQQTSLSVSQLAHMLGVSEVTIRKDLTLLEQQQMLYRVHGSAILANPYIQERHVNDKEKLCSDQKRAIGAYAARLVEPRDTILIASGTTTLAMAREIREVEELTAILRRIQESLDEEIEQKRDVSLLRENYRRSLPILREDRKSTRLNSSHTDISRMPSSA